MIVQDMLLLGTGAEAQSHRSLWVDKKLGLVLRED